VSGSNFNPRNTFSIPVVKIIAFLEFEQKSEFFKSLKKWLIPRDLRCLLEQSGNPSTNGKPEPFTLP